LSIQLGWLVGARPGAHIPVMPSIIQSRPIAWQPPQAQWTSDREAKAVVAEGLVRRIWADHPTAALATSLQVEDAVIVDLGARAGVPISLFMLETGRLPEETLDAKRDLDARYGVRIDTFLPEPDEVRDWIARHGAEAFTESVALRQQCCAIRKVRPLARALNGRTAWVTGQRREQAATRSELAEHEFDAVHGLEKFNPLAAWSLEDVWAYARARGIPVHPLYARGYASIGCEPCTRAIRADEDVRAGRWWWEASDSKECGLHPNEVSPAAT
jgi:phosphoadenosine phosphosulfate reductase